MNRFSCLLLLILAGCATPEIVKSNELVEIIEIEPNRRTNLTKQNLLHLFKVYDLAPFIFTKTVHLQSMVIPHSHPVLTLNTRHMGSPDKLLSVFLHEQLHWWAGSKKDNFDRALIKIREMYPELPNELRLNSRSTYLHFLICSLEYQSLKHFLGDPTASDVIRQFIEEDKVYPWIYQEILNRDKDFSAIIKKYQLAPTPPF